MVVIRTALSYNYKRESQLISYMFILVYKKNKRLKNCLKTTRNLYIKQLT